MIIKTKERFVKEVEAFLKKKKLDYRYIGSGDDGGDFLYEYHIISPIDNQIILLKTLPIQYSI